MMPISAGHPCGNKGCAAVIPRGKRFCPEHEQAKQKALDRERGSAAARGYGARWRRLRGMYLARHPLCVDPEQRRNIPAEVDQNRWVRPFALRNRQHGSHAGDTNATFYRPHRNRHGTTPYTLISRGKLGPKVGKPKLDHPQPKRKGSPSFIAHPLRHHSANAVTGPTLRNMTVPGTVMFSHHRNQDPHVYGFARTAPQRERRDRTESSQHDGARHRHV